MVISVRTPERGLSGLAVCLLTIGLAACGGSSSGPGGLEQPPPAPAPPPAPPSAPPSAAPSYVGTWDGSATRTEHTSNETYANETSSMQIAFSESTGLVNAQIEVGGYSVSVQGCEPGDGGALECTYLAGGVEVRLSVSFTGDNASGGYTYYVDQYDGTYALSRTVQGTWSR